MNELFDIQETSTNLIEFEQFNNAFNATPVGMIPTSNTILFKGIVKAGNSGKTLHGVCTAHGPNAMQLIFGFA